MIIESIVVENFKSFKCEEISFKELTILLGANASGKSNTINVFRFINNIIKYGIDNAISLLGGIDYTTNTSIGRTQPIHIKFKLNVEDEKWIRVIDKSSIGLKILNIVNEFKITPHKRGQGFRIDDDYLEINYQLSVVDKNKSKVDEDRINHSNKYVKLKIFKNKNRIQYTYVDESGLAKEFEFSLGIKFLVTIMNEDRNELILNKLLYLLPPIFSSNCFINIYDFDPKLLKRSCSILSVNNLEEDGSNLARILQRILKNTSARRKFGNILSECLPFVEGISIENNFDKSVSYKLKEKYNNTSFYANFLSDGTANIIALIVALYFEQDSGIIIIEEPERNMHPKLMSKIIEMAKETSYDKQVIITSHNPELVKYSDIENVLFASRCKKGFTVISEPKNNIAVNSFLKAELGLEDLFVQDLLGE